MEPKSQLTSWSLFAGTTSLHAVVWTTLTDKTFVKVFWCLALIGALGVLSIHTNLLVTTFLKFETATKTSMRTNETMQFPAVTICNLNPIKKKNLMCTTRNTIVRIEYYVNKETKQLLVRKKELNRLSDGYFDQIDCDQLKQKMIDNLNGSSNATKEFWMETIDQIFNITGNVPPSSTLNPPTDAPNYNYDYNNSYNYDYNNYNYENINDNTTATDNNTYDYYNYDNYNPDYNYNNNYPSEYNSYYEGYNNEYNYYNYEYNYVDLFENVSVSMQNFEKLVTMSKLDDFEDLRDLVKFKQEELTLFGYTANELIIECSFDRKHCSYKDFFEFSHDRYGRCYIFNSAFHKSNKIRRTRRYGSANGLRLTLNIQADQYVGFLASEYGIRTAVHHPNIIPFPENGGVNAGPGSMTSLSMRYYSIHRKTKPFESNCTSKFPPEFENFTTSEIYTIVHCEVACLNEALFKSCNCTEVKRSRGGRICDMLDESQRECIKDVYTRFNMMPDETGAINCHCAPPCQEINYQFTLSQIPWPTTAYMNMLMKNFLKTHKIAKEFFETTSVDEYGVPNNTNYVKENLVRLKVHYEEMNYQEITEGENYSIESLFADFGGILGLYVGVSVITLIEIFQLVCLYLMPAVRKWYDINPNQVEPLPAVPVNQISQLKLDNVNQYDYFVAY